MRNWAFLAMHSVLLMVTGDWNANVARYGLWNRRCVCELGNDCRRLGDSNNWRWQWSTRDLCGRHGKKTHVTAVHRQWTIAPNLGANGYGIKQSRWNRIAIFRTVEPRPMKPFRRSSLTTGNIENDQITNSGLPMTPRRT